MRTDEITYTDRRVDINTWTNRHYEWGRWMARWMMNDELIEDKKKAQRGKALDGWTDCQAEWNFNLYLSRWVSSRHLERKLRQLIQQLYINVERSYVADCLHESFSLDVFFFPLSTPYRRDFHGKYQLCMLIESVTGICSFPFRTRFNVSIAQSLMWIQGNKLLNLTELILNI